MISQDTLGGWWASFFTSWRQNCGKYIGWGKGRLCLAARETDILGNCERHWAGTTFPPFVSGDCLLNAVFALLSIGSCSFQPGVPFNRKGTHWIFVFARTDKLCALPFPPTPLFWSNKIQFINMISKHNNIEYYWSFANVVIFGHLEILMLNILQNIWIFQGAINLVVLYLF